MAQQGRNKGVTSPTTPGLLDLIPLNQTAGYPQIQVQIVGFGLALTSNLVRLFGPGDGTTPTYYGSTEEGGGQAHGTIQSAQRPFPPTLHNLQGTLTMQADTNCTIAVPAIIKSLSCDRDAKNNETWGIKVDWVKNGQPVVTWNGQTVSYTQPTLAIKENNDGSVRVDDPNWLTTGAATHMFFPTVNYQDTASAALIQSYLAIATPPRSNLKVTTSQAIRIDDFAIMLLVNWGVNNTKDERELPATSTTIDNASLSSVARIGRVNSTAGTLTGFALRATTSQQLTAGGTGNFFTATEFGLRTTAEDITFPGTFTVADDNDLDTRRTYTLVTNNSAPSYAPPSGLKIVSHRTTQLTSSLGSYNQFQTVFELAKNDSKDQRIIPETWTITDNNSLNSKASVSAIDATPSLPGGYKTLDTRTQIITGDSAHTQTTITGALRDSADEVTFPKSSEFRSAQAPWRSAQAQIVAASGDLPTQATSLWNTFQSVVKAYGLTLVPLTDNKRCVVYEYADPGVLVEGYTSGGGRYLKTQLNGTNPQVYIASNISRGSGLRKIQLAQQWVVDKPIRRFLLRRFLQGTQIPEQAPSTIDSVTMPSIGNVNSGSFLGLSAGTALYEGPQYSVNIGLSGTLPFFMGYQFFADSAGVSQGLPDIWFRQPILLTTNYSGTGWTNVSSIGLSDVVTPTAASFAAFTA